MAMNKNKALAINLAMVSMGMLMLAYASVPLYKIFCSVTGFGGTTQVAKELPTDIRARKLHIRFDTNVERGMGWEFSADQLQSEVHVGENGLAFFTVKNVADHDVVGVAAYNVTPEKTGKYFNKVYCFCFDEQTIKAGEVVQFPVSYYVDPRFDDDHYMDDVNTITLSYTFYKVKK